MQPILSAALHRHLGLFPEQPAPEASAADDDAFRRGCHARLLHHCRLLGAAVLIFTLLWWPTDPLVYRGLPEMRPAMGLWRLVVVCCCVLGIALLQVPVLRRRPLLLFSLVASINLAAMGYTAGLMGGPDRPPLHLLYVTYFGTMIVPLDLLPRLLLTAQFALSVLLGFFVPFPQYLASPYVPIIFSFSACVMALSVGFGHILFVLSRENFLLAQKIRGQAADLADANANLEARVTARTAELRRLLLHLETAREDERARISRELHDELGQELSALRFALRHAQGRYAQDPGAIGPNLAELEMLLGRTGAAARSLVSDLRPRVLDDLGLEAAAEWLVGRVRERTGLDCALRIDRRGGEAPGGEAAMVAFRVLQESLTNIERHAGAARIDIELRLAPDAIDLSVKDDGAGFTPGTRGQGGGMGLIGMRERALGVGGALAIDSRPGQGTRVRLHLPAPRREAAAPS